MRPCNPFLYFGSRIYYFDDYRHLVSRTGYGPDMAVIQRSDVRGQMSEVRCQRSEVRGQKSDVRGQMSEFRRLDLVSIY